MLEVQIMGEEGMVNLAVQEFYKLRVKKLEKEETEKMLRNLTETGGPSGHQKLQVCDVCGAYLSRLDNDRRLADHFFGKMHLGYAQMRKESDRLQKELKGRAPPVRNDPMEDDRRDGGYHDGGYGGGGGGYGMNPYQSPQMQRANMQRAYAAQRQQAQMYRAQQENARRVQTQYARQQQAYNEQADRARAQQERYMRRAQAAQAEQAERNRESTQNAWMHRRQPRGRVDPESLQCKY